MTKKGRGSLYYQLEERILTAYMKIHHKTECLTGSTSGEVPLNSDEESWELLKGDRVGKMDGNDDSDMNN
eukprot:1258449-Ditylum_brightwellii.AAC.2